MRAIVLVGGEGTRLRPLSWRTPKQLMPVLNRPLLDHLLLHLRRHGVDRVTLAMTRHNEAIREAFGDGSRLGIALDYAYEETPLGSGGAIASVANGWAETFLVCNGDIITDLDFTAMIAAHRERTAELSISLHEVDDPSPFGVVEIDETGHIRRFVEKPPREEAPSNLINAGAWIFEPSLLTEMDATRFNRVEDTLFPALSAAGRAIYGFYRPSYWADVGNARALLAANLDLAGVSAICAAGSAISSAATVEAPAVIGAGCIVEPEATVTESLLWDGVHVERGAIVRRSILASGVQIGAGACIEDAVIGHGARVAPGACVTGDAIEPGEAVAKGAVNV